MARLASKAKAGFYPTPDKVCGLLKELIEIEDGARLLDPCCGRGKTLSNLAEGTPGKTYGIELDHLRAVVARNKLSCVLWGDALTETRVSPASFSLLYLNPPYDYEMALNSKAERLEVKFLKRYTSVLQKDGWLVLVIPYTILKFCAVILARHFDMLQVFSFPEDEFQAFKQCVILGRKRPLVSKGQARKTQSSLVWLANRKADDFLTIAPQLDKATGIIVPSPRGTLATFKSWRVDPLEIIPMVHKYGLMDDILNDLVPRQCNSIRPLAPLENGHLALMLAGGYMNGEIELSGKRLVIKGVVRKSEKVQRVTENAAGDTTVITRDQYMPTVKAIDMEKAEMITIQ